MNQDTVREIWGILAANLLRLEQGPELPKGLREQTQIAVSMLLECDPAQVLQCLEESTWPQRALVSWLVYEGAPMGLAEQAGALERQWRQDRLDGGELIAPPRPKTASRPLASV